MGRVDWLERGTKELCGVDGNVSHHVLGDGYNPNWVMSTYTTTKIQQTEHLKYVPFIAYTFYLKKKIGKHTHKTWVKRL